MKTYRSLNYTSVNPTVCALGCFDGVHMGHASIIKRAKELSKELSADCAVWSFAEPPKNFFSSEKIPLLTTAEEKRAQMRSLGVDIFVSVPFDKRIASMTAKEFFYTVLIDAMKVKHVVCGFNYRFGRGGEGDPALLERLCDENGIGLSIMPPVKSGDVAISSTEIRNALTSGNVDDATIYLGRPYSLSAKIIDGQHLGRTLGFPTVNQSFPKGKLVPRNGVYVSRVAFDGRIKYGITNIGVRPTVDGKSLCAETNLFDFEGDLYGKTLNVEFLTFLRPEQKFGSVEKLAEQVGKDILMAKDFIKKHAI